MTIAVVNNKQRHKRKDSYIILSWREVCVVDTLWYAKIFSVSEINWFPYACVLTCIKYATNHSFIFYNKMLCFCLIRINSSGFCFIIRFSSFNLTRKLTAFFFYIIHLKIITKKSQSCCNWSNGDFTNLLLVTDVINISYKN